eukprot:7384401-Prymnesium_polylepis.1
MSVSAPAFGCRGVDVGARFKKSVGALFLKCKLNLRSSKPPKPQQQQQGARQSFGRHAGAPPVTLHFQLPTRHPHAFVRLHGAGRLSMCFVPSQHRNATPLAGLVLRAPTVCWSLAPRVDCTHRLLCKRSEPFNSKMLKPVDDAVMRADVMAKLNAETAYVGGTLNDRIVVAGDEATRMPGLGRLAKKLRSEKNAIARGIGAARLLAHHFVLLVAHCPAHVDLHLLSGRAEISCCVSGRGLVYGRRVALEGNLPDSAVERHVPCAKLHFVLECDAKAVLESGHAVGGQIVNQQLRCTERQVARE